MNDIHSELVMTKLYKISLLLLKYVKKKSHHSNMCMWFFPSFFILLDESDSATAAVVARSNKKESGWIFLFWFHISEHKMIWKKIHFIMQKYGGWLLYSAGLIVGCKCFVLADRRMYGETIKVNTKLRPNQGRTYCNTRPKLAETARQTHQTTTTRQTRQTTSSTETNSKGKGQQHKLKIILTEK